LTLQNRIFFPFFKVLIKGNVMNYTTKIRKFFFLATLVAAGIAALFVYRHQRSDAKPSAYRIARAEKGRIVNSVSSTGTLTPVTTVQVGSQVSGQIKELLADFNSEVRRNQIIARIDPENFEARVRQAEAELAVAHANVAIQEAAAERSRAELENARAALAAAKAKTERAHVVVMNAKRDLDRKQALYRKGVISESTIDDAKATYDEATAQFRSAEADQEAQSSVVLSREAQLKMARAQVQHAVAQVKQREAALYNSKVDLDHTVIRSPLDGVVINRNVDIGQTVAASLQAPTLFTIAQDLRKMQVDTDVDEADIGSIQVGQRVTFTVDAFPGREFAGRVEEIRKAPETVQNVVTYTVVVSAENRDQRLLPGMTANVQIVIDERFEVLKVHNAALRFQPPHDGAAVEGSPSPRQPAISHDRESEQEARLSKLFEALDLNEEQETKVRSIFEEQRERIRDLRRKGAEPQMIRDELQRLRQASRNALLEMLTPQQQEKYRQMRAAREANSMMRGRVWVVGEGGKPKPVEVIAGISDGSFTEIVRGDLEAGQEVIVGMMQSERRPSGGGLGRVGF
jgi:HlyD family secretion protein